MQVEQEHSISSVFVTLTYNDANLPWSDEHQAPVLHKPDLMQFLHDVRKANRRRIRVGKKRVNVGEPFRHFSCGEYGGKTRRPHYHGILFNLSPNVISRLGEIWGKGWVKVGTVTPKSCNYVAKYTMKLDHDLNVQGKFPKPFMVATKRSGGIGKQWINEPNIVYAKEKLDGQVFNRRTGKFQPMPMYYKRRIFDFPERAIIRATIEAKLDKSFSDTIEVLSKTYEDPYAEFHRRELVYIENVKQRIRKQESI